MEVVGQWCSSGTTGSKAGEDGWESVVRCARSTCDKETDESERAEIVFLNLALTACRVCTVRVPVPMMKKWFISLVDDEEWEM